MLPALMQAVGSYLRRLVWVLYSSPIGKKTCTRSASRVRKALLIAQPRNAPRWSNTIWNTLQNGKLSPVPDSNGHYEIIHTILRIDTSNRQGLANQR